MSHFSIPRSKVLVVEDDDNYRRIVAMILSASGYANVLAPTHDEAISRLNEDADLGIILLDHSMHGCGPDQFLEKLDQPVDSLRIIGHSSFNRAKEFAALGIHTFLPKPLNLEHFAHAVAAFAEI